MPHSLRVRLKNLNHKGLLTDRELERLINALDTVDHIEDARTEMAQRMKMFEAAEDYNNAITTKQALGILDRHIRRDTE